MENFFEKSLIASKITKIYRICDLVGFEFEMQNLEKLHLHVLCYLRIFDSDGMLVVCTQNMSNRSKNYRKKLFKKYDWTKVGATVFDDAINDCKADLMSTKVSEVKFDNNDIRIMFENNMRMDVLVAMTKYDDIDYCENYRIFNDDKEKDHFIV